MFQFATSQHLTLLLRLIRSSHRAKRQSGRRNDEPSHHIFSLYLLLLLLSILPPLIVTLELNQVSLTALLLLLLWPCPERIARALAIGY